MFAGIIRMETLCSALSAELSAGNRIKIVKTESAECERFAASVSASSHGSSDGDGHICPSAICLLLLDATRVRLLSTPPRRGSLATAAAAAALYRVGVDE
ncbi:hypothetical protein OUZ56_027852 [Daphnia magna]|uniref:Uncharacterized protein n=1 Tax=Daphnia magna TaxID=35525 RepID=A0ABR0B246_9CRUS|nr:hypothetical protein OUZ56_027852 [Daphnia magna]